MEVASQENRGSTRSESLRGIKLNRLEKLERKWRRAPESNRPNTDLQSVASPLCQLALLEKDGAGYRARTDDLYLGKVSLYQLS